MSRADFAGRGVVVTGGSSGLGRALAERLAGGGARVALVARNRERLEQARAEIAAGAPTASVICAPLDVGSADGLAEAFDDLAARLDGIDVLINSAGIMREGYFETLPDAAFREAIDVNLFGLVRCTRAALPHLRRMHGRVVNIASAGGLIGVFGYTAYTASKFAVVGFSESLRYELARQDVSVHVVCPPEFQTPMIDALDDSRTPENRAHTLMIPKHDVGRVADETLRGVARGRFMIVPGPRTRLAVGAVRHLPGMGRRLGDLVVARAARPEH